VARPYTPTDKGRTEREIRYVKESCFRGRGITEYEDAKRHLARWHAEVSMVRVHGTTRRRPLDLFEEERAALGALPDTPYEITCSQRSETDPGQRLETDPPQASSCTWTGQASQA
jgi:hypothetical protein